MIECTGLNKTNSPLRLGELMERNSLKKMKGQRIGKRAVECCLLTLIAIVMIKTLSLHKTRPVNRHLQGTTVFL